MSNNETDMAATEVVPLSAIHAMERAQIDTQVATAHQYPRNLEQFKKRALAMATMDIETAESCIYVRPVGKEQNAKGQWVEKYAEGPSVRMAEIVGCCYGNLRVASRLVEQTARSVKAEGVCHDLETNYAGKTDIVESTVNKKGEPYSERQQALTAKVAVAKAYRDAIFRIVPRALIKPVFEAAKKIVSGQATTIGERIKKVQAWLAMKRIEHSRVFAALGITDWSQVTEDHLMTLTGLKTAVQDGEPIDEIFPPVETAAGAPANAPKPTGLQQSQQAAAAPKPAAPPAQKAAAPAQAPTAAAQPAPAEQPKRGPGRPRRSTMVEQPLTPQEAAELNANGVKAQAPAPAAPPPVNLPPIGTAPAASPEPAEAQTPTPTAESEGAAPDAELSAMGLAPEPDEPPPAPAPEPPPQPAWFDRQRQENDQDLHVRMMEGLDRLATASGVTLSQIKKFCEVNKLATPQQKLNDMATQKLQVMGKQWAVLLPKIKAFPA